MLGVFLLPAFTRQGHERQELLSSCDGMHRLDLGLCSHPTEFWGNGVRTHVNSKEKISSTGKKSPQRRMEPTTLRQAGQRAQHTTNELNTLPTSSTHYQRAQHTTNESNTLPTSSTHYQRAQHTTNELNTLPTSPTHYQRAQHTTNESNTLPTSSTHYQRVQHTTNELNTLPTSQTHYQRTQHTTKEPNTLPTSYSGPQSRTSHASDFTQSGPQTTSLVTANSVCSLCTSLIVVAVVVVVVVVVVVFTVTNIYVL